MDELIQIIGKEKVDALRATYGGQSLHIPKELRNRHPIIKIIGLVAALKLCEQLSGNAFYIQKLPSAPLASRNELIRSERLTGKTLRALATEHNLSSRQISTILKLT